MTATGVIVRAWTARDGSDVGLAVGAAEGAPRDAEGAADPGAVVAQPDRIRRRAAIARRAGADISRPAYDTFRHDGDSRRDSRSAGGFCGRPTQVSTPFCG
jgi:hypothetical protein